jgi:hypothetical protein
MPWVLFYIVFFIMGKVLFGFGSHFKLVGSIDIEDDEFWSLLDYESFNNFMIFPKSIGL